MKNISQEMYKFREASRHVWNVYLMPGMDVVDFERENSFYLIEKELLRCLVLNDGDLVEGYRKRSIDGLLVQPKSEFSEIEVQFGKKGVDGNTSWGTTEVVDSGYFVGFEFFDFFDWWHYGFIDNSIVRVVEKSSGRMALIHHRYCEFWLRE